MLSYSSVHQRCKMDFTRLKSRCLQACIPFEGSRRESISLPFPPSRSYLHSLAHGPVLQPQSQQNSIFKYLSDSDTPISLFHVRGNFWLHWDHQDNPRQSPPLKILNLLASTKSLLPYKVIYSQVLRVRMWASWWGGGYYSAYHRWFGFVLFL